MPNANQAADVPVRMIRYGVDAPLPERVMLRAGPVSATLERGDLRYVTVNGVEVIRRLYMAVRDHNWDTIEPRYVSFEVDEGPDSFHVRFTAEHVKGDVDFAWQGTIDGETDGTIVYRMDGEPRQTFLRNRIGFCVLHPMALAGTPAESQTPDGTVSGPFPDLISPDQPFMDMVSISHAAGDGARATISFDGDLFEMEDQRNWTDASYKTYGTPLRIPYPVRVEPGERIVQTVTLTVTGAFAEVRSGRDGDSPDVSIGDTPLGALPPIGFEMASHAQPLDEEQIDRLRSLRPAHLHVGIDLSADDWQDRLRRAASEANALRAGLQLSVIAGQADDGVDRLAALLAETDVQIARIFIFPPVAAPIVFPRTDLETNREMLDQARTAFATKGIGAPVGGGARSYFTEFNRAQDRLPLDAMAVATYTLNPQVHAFDNLSLVETLAAQAETVRSAKAIAGDIPLAVGPITLRPRYNPNATGPEPETPADELPPAVDPRQLSLFGAGWTVGSIRNLSSAGPESLTYFETTGWRGVMERRDKLTRHDLFPTQPGQLFPLYHVFAALASMAGGAVLPVALANPLETEALAVRQTERVVLLVASFVDEEQTVTVASPPIANATVRYLDETTAAAAMNDSSFLADPNGDPVDASGGRITLLLKPFGVARVIGVPA